MNCVKIEALVLTSHNIISLSYLIAEGDTGRRLFEGVRVIQNKQPHIALVPELETCVETQAQREYN